MVVKWSRLANDVLWTWGNIYPNQLWAEMSKKGRGQNYPKVP